MCKYKLSGMVIKEFCKTFWPTCRKVYWLHFFLLIKYILMVLPLVVAP